MRLQRGIQPLSGRSVTPTAGVQQGGKRYEKLLCDTCSIKEVIHHMNYLKRMGGREVSRTWRISRDLAYNRHLEFLTVFACACPPNVLNLSLS